MAVIGKIRKQAGLLIGLVGVSLLAFILGDLLTSNRSFISDTGTNAGVIAGEKIGIQDFEARVQKSIENYKLNSNTESVDQGTVDALREQTWNQIINELVMGRQYKKLGITVSSDELFDMVQGKDPHQQIKEAFKDPKTGIFSQANVIQFLKNMDNDPTGKARAQWLVFEKAIREERVGQKYNELLRHGLHVTTEEAKRDYNDKGRMASMKYITFNYNTLPDTAVTYTERDLKDYYNDHQKTYKQEASRKMDFVLFEVLPSVEDKAAIYEEVNKLTGSFKASPNDSLYLALNSDEKTTPLYMKKGALAPILDTVAFTLPAGEVIGPYEENNFYKLSKISGVKDFPDSVKARHILLKVENVADSVVKAQADSIKGLIENGANFDLLAMQHSKDPGSAMKGGDLGWFGEGMMVKPFNDACFEGQKGDLVVVKSEFGYHIIRVEDQSAKSPRVKISTVSRRIEPGSKTYQEVYNKANRFAGSVTTAEEFDKKAKEMGYDIRNADFIRETDKNLPGVEGAREVVRWVYSGKKGDLSKAFELENKFVVGKITEVKDQGIAPLDQVKDLVTAEVRKQKKHEKFVEKINKQAGSAKTIEELGTKLSTPPVVADNVSFGSAYIQGLGSEPEVVGVTFTSKPGAISKPIKGVTGTFVISVTNFNEPAPTNDYSGSVNILQQTYQSRVNYEVMQALKEKAKIKDYRGKFY
jgi:peptidyl-prolyl cis-trans isomerase D